MRRPRRLGLEPSDCDRYFLSLFSGVFVQFYRGLNGFKLGDLVPSAQWQFEHSPVQYLASYTQVKPYLHKSQATVNRIESIKNHVDNSIKVTLICYSRYTLLMPNYTAFGLTIDADLDFPELQVIAKPARSDVLIRNKKPSQTTGFCFTIDAIGTFEITEKHQITYNVRPETDLRNLRLFLLGSCMGALLQQRGYLVLHGNAISTIDRQNTMIFLGNQGVGKSTTAAWHLTQGHRILADDICAITFNANGEALLIPSYPQPKLWQDSAELLGIQTTGLTRRPCPSVRSLNSKSKEMPRRLQDIRNSTRSLPTVIGLDF